MSVVTPCRPCGRDAASTLARSPLGQVGWHAVFRVLDDHALARLSAEASSSRAGAAGHRAIRPPDESTGPRGQPARWLESAPGGPALHRPRLPHELGTISVAVQWRRQLGHDQRGGRTELHPHWATTGGVRITTGDCVSLTGNYVAQCSVCVMHSSRHPSRTCWDQRARASSRVATRLAVDMPLRHGLACVEGRPTSADHGEVDGGIPRR